MSGLLKWLSPQLTQLVSSCSQSIDVFIDEVENLLSDTRARLKLVAITYEPAIASQLLTFAANGFTRDHEGIRQ